jgi:hypothetical protein
LLFPQTFHRLLLRRLRFQTQRSERTPGGGQLLPGDHQDYNSNRYDGMVFHRILHES